MGRKILIGFGICCGIITVLWIVARVTGMLLFYNIPTASNEPTIKQGDKVFTTNLKQAKRYQFIAFKSKYQDSVMSTYMENYETGAIYLHRLCGTPGDILEMKNGILFVNNKKWAFLLPLLSMYVFDSVGTFASKNQALILLIGLYAIFFYFLLF